MTEREAYEILKKPFIRTREVAALLEVDRTTAGHMLKKRDVKKDRKGVYYKADFLKKFGLESYWKQVSRFAET